MLSEPRPISRKIRKSPNCVGAAGLLEPDSGELFFEGRYLFWPFPGKQQGISLIHPAEGVGFPFDADVDIVRVLAKGLANPVAFRLFFQTQDIKKVLKRNLPRIGGCFATALDGCLGSMDAALTQPYSNDAGNRGILVYDDHTIFKFIQDAHDAGLQVQVHAIGDAAFDQATQGFAQALKNNPRKDHRHSIIHASVISQQGLELCAEHDIGIAAQPALNNLDLEPLPYLKEILGERTDLVSPFRTMLDMGIHVSGSSDAPVTVISLGSPPVARIAPVGLI